jgi:hypothetical protein
MGDRVRAMRDRHSYPHTRFALELGVGSIGEQLQGPFIENGTGKAPAPAASVRLRSRRNKTNLWDAN